MSGTLQDTTVTAFIDMIEEFIDAISEVFPECTQTKEYKLKFKMAVRDHPSEKERETNKLKLINAWHEAMTPYYNLCAKRDPKMFTEGKINFFENFSMRDKWLDVGLDEESRQCIWEFILELNRFAQMACGLFNKIPEKTLGKIQETALNLATKINSGSMTMGDLNLNSIGEEVVNGLDENEIQEFTKNVMGDTSVLQNLCAGMLGGMGNPMANMGENNGGGPNMAAAALAMQMMQGMSGPTQNK